MKRQKNESFTFELDNEKLNQFKKLGALAILTWLHEANEFLQKTLTKKQKKDWDNLKHNKS